MVKKLSLFGTLILLLSNTAFAQRTCGTMEYLEQQKALDPGLEQRMQQIELETQQYVKDHPNSSGERAVITIPVVFHVVYRTTTENISDQRIFDQLKAMNEDFRKLNANISTVPSVWQSIAADMEIEFCLAQRDPSGNATTGITRTSTTLTGFTDDDKVKFNAQGGKDNWDRSKYLNIWVCNLTGSLLGYATFPGGTATKDGVVCNYRYVGLAGAQSPFNLGRTATHEIGHWLNLRHIWGDSNCGNDQVSDTPTQQTSNSRCPSFPHVTCSNGPNGDMFMNYMDYSDDACMSMFSAGQKTRALAALNGTRASLKTSNGCVPLNTNALASIALTTGTNPACEGVSLTFTATPTNGGTTPAYQWKVNGTNVGTNSATYTTNTLTNGQIVTCVMTSNMSGVTGNPTTSNAITLTINPKPAPGISGTNTICKGNSTTLSTSGGGTYSWNIGATNSAITVSPTSTATYSVIVTNTGCSGTASRVVTVKNTPSVPTITQNGAILTSSSSTGNQWYLNGNLIPGATNKDHTITANGNYTVVVTINGCPSVASLPVNVINTQIDEEDTDGSLSIYPNPNDGVFTCSFNTIERSNYIIEIRNTIGQVIYKQLISNHNGPFKKQIHLMEYGKGCYLISLSSSDKETIKKVIVY